MASKTEKAIQQEIRLECNHGDKRLWRNNSGIATYPDGSKVKYGLCDGASDLIGYYKLKITPEMVGKEVAVFCAIEVKNQKGRVSLEQHRFVNFIIDNGGVAGIARGVEDVKNLFDSFKERLQS